MFLSWTIVAQYVLFFIIIKLSVLIRFALRVHSEVATRIGTSLRLQSWLGEVLVWLHMLQSSMIWSLELQQTGESSVQFKLILLFIHISRRNILDQHSQALLQCPSGLILTIIFKEKKIFFSFCVTNLMLYLQPCH